MSILSMSDDDYNHDDYFNHYDCNDKHIRNDNQSNHDNCNHCNNNNGDDYNHDIPNNNNDNNSVYSTPLLSNFIRPFPFTDLFSVYVREYDIGLLMVIGVS